MQKYGYLASHAVKSPFTCIICETQTGFNWSDLHGEGMCNSCGVPYDLKKDPPECNLFPEWVIICRQYYQETKSYMGLGQIAIWDQYPECREGRVKFGEWIVKNHPELCKTEAKELEKLDNQLEEIENEV